MTVNLMRHHGNHTLGVSRLGLALLKDPTSVGVFPFGNPGQNEKENMNGPKYSFLCFKNVWYENLSQAPTIVCGLPCPAVPLNCEPK